MTSPQAVSERPLPPSVEFPVTAQEVTDALAAHHLRTDSPEARRDMRRTLEQFLDRRSLSSADSAMEAVLKAAKQVNEDATTYMAALPAGVFAGLSALRAALEDLHKITEKQ